MERNHEYEMRCWQFTAEQDQLLLDSRAEQVKQLEEEVEELEEQLKDKDKKVTECEDRGGGGTHERRCQHFVVQ